MDQPLAAIAVIGAGSWGTALAALLARNGHPTTIWGRDPAVIQAITKTGQNSRYLPGIDLPKSLRASDDFLATIQQADGILVATPSHAFAESIRQIADAKTKIKGLAWATKGFEPGSGRFLHEVASKIFGPELPLAAITGPSFAKEVAMGLPTAVTVHSDHADFAQKVARALHSPSFRAYTGDDLTGAELGGAMKNVLAVATGVADGMNLGLNARAGLITRGLNEMLRLNATLGGRAETIMGLAGVGDLVLTCTGDLSRNRRLGLALGRGESIKDAVRAIGQVVESIQTADEIMRLAERHGVELPISEQVQRVLHGKLTPMEALAELMAREQKPEYTEQLL